MTISCCHLPAECVLQLAEGFQHNLNIMVAQTPQPRVKQTCRLLLLRFCWPSIGSFYLQQLQITPQLQQLLLLPLLLLPPPLLLLQTPSGLTTTSQLLALLVLLQCLPPLVQLSHLLQQLLAPAPEAGLMPVTLLLCCKQVSR